MSNQLYREKAIREFGEQCQRCGTEETVLVHHKDGNRDNNSLSNLIPLGKLRRSD